MKRKLKIFITGIIVFFMSNIIAVGTDFDDPIMRNDHDTLLIGEIISVDEDEVAIQALKHIVSAYDLTEGVGERQLSPEMVRVVNNNQMSAFRVGDHVLASLNQEDNLFVIAWGIYKLDIVYELDFPMWHVETGDLLTSVILSDFINQQGRYTYSVREDGTVIRHQGDAEIVIYDPDPPTEIEPRTEEDPEHTSMFLIVGVTSSVLIALIVWFAYKKSKQK
jgi:hypothetical protein